MFLDIECKLVRYDGKGTSTKLCAPRFLIPSMTLGPSNLTLQEIGLFNWGNCWLPLLNLVRILKSDLKGVELIKSLNTNCNIQKVVVMSLEGERALLPTATVASNYWVWKVIHVYWFFFTFSLWLITKTRTSFSTNKEQNQNQQPFSCMAAGSWWLVHCALSSGSGWPEG